MKVLMVCLGNICRSPLAHGLLQHKINRLSLDWYVDSAGTSYWHIGELPDERSISIASANGVDIGSQRARQISLADLKIFDIIFVMDSSNFQNVLKLDQKKQYSHKIKLILNSVYPDENRSVPDPYYNDRFQEVFDMLDKATDQIIEDYS